MKEGSQQQALGVEVVEGGGMVLRFDGDYVCWGSGEVLEGVEGQLRGGGVSGLRVDGGGLGEWDSSLLAFLNKVRKVCEEVGVACDYGDLPEGAQKILSLAQGPVVRSGVVKARRYRFIEHLGIAGMSFWRGGVELMGFMGESVLSFVNLVRGRASCRFSDFILLVQEVGAEALPIVSLISILVGMTMAFVGAVQLEKFGATIFVADLVGLVMVREMGAVMTAIVLCGRTGAAFAATIGSMKVTEEIDALKTTGISPVEFLVLPRILALFLMMPLLVVFSDLIGMFGGLVVGVGIMDLSLAEYLHQTQEAVRLQDVWTGIIKSVVFGILVALTGCLRGMQCGDSSAAVGRATTSAVVTGITAIIVADALFAVLFDSLGI